MHVCILELSKLHQRVNLFLRGEVYVFGLCLVYGGPCLRGVDCLMVCWYVSCVFVLVAIICVSILGVGFRPSFRILNAHVCGVAPQ